MSIENLSARENPLKKLDGFDLLSVDQQTSFLALPEAVITQDVLDMIQAEIEIKKNKHNSIEATHVRESAGQQKVEDSARGLDLATKIESGQGPTEPEAREFLNLLDRNGLKPEEMVQLKGSRAEYSNNPDSNLTANQPVANLLTKQAEIRAEDRDESAWNEAFVSGERAYEVFPRQQWIDFGLALRTLYPRIPNIVQNAIAELKRAQPESMFAAILRSGVANDSRDGFSPEALKTWASIHRESLMTGQASKPEVLAMAQKWVENKSVMDDKFRVARQNLWTDHASIRQDFLAGMVQDTQTTTAKLAGGLVSDRLVAA